MAETVKGLNIKLSLDGRDLENELKEIQSDLKEQQKDLKAINANLKYDSSNVELWKQKQSKLNDILQTTKKKLETQNQELEKAKQALRIIWKEQPVASDLRLVTGILKLITDLERIGDHASDIAEMTLHLEDKRNQRLLPITSKMAEVIENMVLSSIQALIKVDEKTAADVIAMDDEVDSLFDQLVEKITRELKEDKIDPNEAVYVLMVAKYIERVGDHAVNIAEWIIFMVKGTHKNTLLF